MVENITFSDLLALEKITPNTIVEKFGSLINSSFFDAANILGSLKIKGLVDYGTSAPGQNVIQITELGKKVLDDAKSKSAMEIDKLDIEIIHQLSSGKRNLVDISNSINVGQTDLAMHLSKLQDKGYVESGFRNGIVNLNLTDKGFNFKVDDVPTQTNNEVNEEKPESSIPNDESIMPAESSAIMEEKTIEEDKPSIEKQQADNTESSKEANTEKIENNKAKDISNTDNIDESDTTHEIEDLRKISETMKPSDEELSQELKAKHKGSGGKKIIIGLIIVIIVVIILVLKFR